MKKKKMRLAESSGGGAAAASGPVKIPGPAPSAATLPAPQYEGKPPEECRSGDLPHGEYHQAEKIGAGSYGAISAVYDDDGELFALKVFDEGDDSSVDIGTLREMSMLRLLRGDLAHPFIVQAHDFYISQKYSSVCMVMPKAVGSVKDVLLGKLRLEKNGGKPRVAYQLLSALAYLHDNGIMHRDVKPDNVLLNANMEPVLCDFSLATFSSRGYAGPTHSGDVGTAVYMAPEVCAACVGVAYDKAALLWTVAHVFPLLPCFCLSFRVRGCSMVLTAHANLCWDPFASWHACRCTANNRMTSCVMPTQLACCCLRCFRVHASALGKTSKPRSWLQSCVASCHSGPSATCFVVSQPLSQQSACLVVTHSPIIHSCRAAVARRPFACSLSSMPWYVADRARLFSWVF